MHYLSIHFHPNFEREFVRAVSRELDDGPFLTRTDPDFCRERGMMYEDDSYQQPEKALLCHLARQRRPRTRTGISKSLTSQRVNFPKVDRNDLGYLALNTGMLNQGSGTDPSVLSVVIQEIELVLAQRGDRSAGSNECDL